jgi:nucleoside-diphosphate-sugar epimerase
MAERYLSYYVAQGVVRGATLRLANVYGPGPRSSSADRGVLNLMIRRALAGEALTIYGSGEHIRDYIYIEDVARAFLLAAINADHLGGRYVVIGSGSGHTIAEAVHLVADRAALHTGRRAPVVHVEPPATLSPIESRNFVADTTAFRQASNWTAAVTLTDGIDRTIMALLTKEGDRS